MNSDSARTTIRRRLLLMLLGPLSLLLSLGIAFDYATVLAPLRAAFDQALVKQALALAAQLHPHANGTIEFELSPQAVEVLRAGKDDAVYYQVLGPHGELLGGDAGLPQAAATAENPVFGDGVFHGENVRAGSYRVATSSGDVTITVAETRSKRQSARRRMLATIIAGDIAQLAGILALVWFGVRIGLRPLLALRAQIDSRSARDLAALDETQVPAEVRPLADALNRLLATVRASAQGQLQFLANAAHQLRTPMTGLQTQIELMLHEPTAAPLHEQLRRMLASTRRLAHTSNQLLALARAEPTAAAVAEFRALDLRELAEEAVAAQFDLALRRRIDLGVEAESARVVGSAWLLRELIANLVDNALTYSAAEGRVTVRSGVTQDPLPLPFLEVEDDGPGIAPEQRLRVVERFYRAPGTTGEGCGLGLAIVDEIARRHHAQLEISGGANNHGTRVRVTFPGAALP